MAAAYIAVAALAAGGSAVAGILLGVGIAYASRKRLASEVEGDEEEEDRSAAIGGRDEPPPKRRRLSSDSEHGGALALAAPQRPSAAHSASGFERELALCRAGLQRTCPALRAHFRALARSGGSAVAECGGGDNVRHLAALHYVCDAAALDERLLHAALPPMEAACRLAPAPGPRRRGSAPGAADAAASAAAAQGAAAACAAEEWLGVVEAALGERSQALEAALLAAMAAAPPFSARSICPRRRPGSAALLALPPMSAASAAASAAARGPPQVVNLLNDQEDDDENSVGEEEGQTQQEWSPFWEAPAPGAKEAAEEEEAEEENEPPARRAVRLALVAVLGEGDAEAVAAIKGLTPAEAKKIIGHRSRAGPLRSLKALPKILGQRRFNIEKLLRLNATG